MGRLSERIMRHVGVRVRSTMAATLVVAVAFTVAAAGLVVVYQRSLVHAADVAASQRAQDVVTQVSRDGIHDQELAASASPSDQTVLQVVGPDGKVVIGSTDLPATAPIAALRPAPGRTARLDITLPDGDQDPLHVVAIGVSTPDGTAVVLVGSPLQSVNDGVAELVTLLLIGGPLLLLVVATATFVFVGGALRPVERIRARVAGITARDLHERVPVPVARDEVGKLAETMNAMLMRLEFSARRQHSFVADASHELRSPLSTVQAGLELLRHTDQVPDQDSIEMLYEETLRLERLIAALLLLARADERGLRLDIDEVDLDDLVDSERRRLAGNPRIKVVTQLTAVRVWGDRHRLGQLLRNLTDNAERHATAVVELHLFERDGTAYLQVKDDGQGIAAADRERVFERFVRLDESRTRSAGGSGLGLAIVREIIAAHDGTVTILDPGSDHGTTIQVELAIDRPRVR